MRSYGGLPMIRNFLQLHGKRIGNESNEVFVSAASAWEIAIKTRIDKLKGILHLLKKYNELIVADNFFTPPHHPPSLPACGKFRLRTQGPV